MNTTAQYAKVAYDAYCEARGWVSVRGDALPQFEAQSPDLQAAWGAAARAVVERFLTPETSDDPEHA